MKLVSKFKDYYDWYIYQVGVDNHVVYNRELETDVTDLVLKSNHNVNKDPVYNKVLFTHRNDHIFDQTNPEFIIEEIYILGDMYTILYIKPKDQKPYRKIANKQDFKSIRDLIENYYKVRYRYIWHGDPFNRILEAWSEGRKTYRDWNDSKYIGPTVGVYSGMKDEILKIHKYFKQPVIKSIYPVSIPQQSKLDKYGKSKIVQKEETKYILTIPNLSEIKGFAGLYPDVDIYKNIYNFLLDVQNDEKLSIPMTIDNDSKIVEAGFDLKSSFRHPTK